MSQVYHGTKIVDVRTLLKKGRAIKAMITNVLALVRHAQLMACRSLLKKGHATMIRHTKLMALVAKKAEVCT